MHTGPRALHAYSAQLALASRVAYFALTTLVGAQTLGEEYVELVQATARTSLPPSLLVRSLSLAFFPLDLLESLADRFAWAFPDSGA